MAEGIGDRIGLALGGGGARGLAHVTMLEAFDEMGLTPCRISGTSIGAMVGSAYAAGLTAAEIRGHVQDTLRSRIHAIRRMLTEGAGNVFDLIKFNPFNSSLIDGAVLLDIVMPAGVPGTFEDLKIPFSAVATDFYGRHPMVLDKGPLIQAVAASIALPGLISPQIIGGRLLIDGGMVNPLPFDQIKDRADIIVAIDVTGGPAGRNDRPPSRAELLFSSSQIMQHSLVKAQLERHTVDIFVAPDVDRFRILEFFKADRIMDAAQPAKDDLKRMLETAINAAG